MRLLSDCRQLRPSYEIASKLFQWRFRTQVAGGGRYFPGIARAKPANQRGSAGGRAPSRGPGDGVPGRGSGGRSDFSQILPRIAQFFAVEENKFLFLISRPIFKEIITVSLFPIARILCL